MSSISASNLGEALTATVDLSKAMENMGVISANSKAQLGQLAKNAQILGSVTNQALQRIVSGAQNLSATSVDDGQITPSIQNLLNVANTIEVDNAPFTSLVGSMDSVASIATATGSEFHNLAGVFTQLGSIDVTTQLANLTGAMGDIENVVMGASAAFSTVNESISNFSNTIATNENAPEMLKNGLAALGSSLTSVQGHLDATATNIAAFRGDFSAIGDNINAVGPNLVAIGDNFTALGDSFGSVKDNLVTLKGNFGALGGSLGDLHTNLTTLDLTSLDPATVTNNLTTLGGNLMTIKDNVTTIGTSFNTLKDSMTTLGSTLNTLKGNLTTLRGTLTNIGQGAGNISSRLGLASKAKKLYSVVSTTLTGTLKLLGGAFRLVGRGVLWMGRALLMNPIGLAITAIGLAAVAIYKYWEPIKGFFSNLWGQIKAAFNGGLAGIGQLILNWSPIGLFYKAFSSVLGWFGVELPNTFTGFIGKIWDSIAAPFSNIAGFFSGVWAQIKTLFSGGISSIGEVLSSWSPLNLITGAFDAVISWFSNLPSTFAELGSSMISGLIDGAKSLLPSVGDLVDSIPGISSLKKWMGWGDDEEGEDKAESGQLDTQPFKKLDTHYAQKVDMNYSKPSTETMQQAQRVGRPQQNNNIQVTVNNPQSTVDVERAITNSMGMQMAGTPLTDGSF